jgi:hypothetical protein
MKLFRLLLPIFFPALMTMGQTSPSVEPSSSELIGEGYYLRMANLLPITQGKIDMLRCNKPVLTGIKPGFYSGYMLLDSSEPYQFLFKKVGSDATFGGFELRSKEKTAFFTVILWTENGKVLAKLYDDQEPQPLKPELPPLKRLRILAGGFGFPFLIDGGPLGQWPSQGESILAEIHPDIHSHTTISVQFINKDNEDIRLYFPVDFKTYNANTVFISQRGPRRPRIRIFPDHVPSTEALESTTASHDHSTATP